MAKRPSFGQIICRTRGDKLVVALIDSDMNPFFKAVAGINNRKELEQLKENLRLKMGIDI